MFLFNPKVDVVKDNVKTKLVKFNPFILKILSKTQILMSIKGRNSVANLQKKTLYNPKIELVNDNFINLYIKFG